MGSFWSVYYHIVFSTKNRIPIINNSNEKLIYSIFRKVAEKFNTELWTANCCCDHTHILVKAGIGLHAEEMIKEMKRLTSFLINNNQEERTFYWQNHYAIFSVSYQNLNNVIAYIDNQKKHHLQQDFESEIKHFLKIAGVEEDFDFD